MTIILIYLNPDTRKTSTPIITDKEFSVSEMASTIRDSEGEYTLGMEVRTSSPEEVFFVFGDFYDIADSIPRYIEVEFLEDYFPEEDMKFIQVLLNGLLILVV